MIKLNGSRTEQNYREELINTHRLLFDGDSYKYIISILYSKFSCIKTAYIIDHIHEQGYDLFTLIIDIINIVTIEIEKCLDDKSSSVKIISINEYKKDLKKKDLIKLAVAIDLVKQDMKKT